MVEPAKELTHAAKPRWHKLLSLYPGLQKSLKTTATALPHKSHQAFDSVLFGLQTIKTGQKRLSLAPSASTSFCSREKVKLKIFIKNQTPGLKMSKTEREIFLYSKETKKKSKESQTGTAGLRQIQCLKFKLQDSKRTLFPNISMLLFDYLNRRTSP